MRISTCHREEVGNASVERNIQAGEEVPSAGSKTVLFRFEDSHHFQWDEMIRIPTKSWKETWNFYKNLNDKYIKIPIES